MKTIGDQVRIIKKQSLQDEIYRLEKQVKSISNNNPDTSRTDSDIQAYTRVIEEKKRELHHL